MQRGRPARPQRDKQAGNYMELAETSRILRFVASVPPWPFRQLQALASMFSSRTPVAARPKKTN